MRRIFLSHAGCWDIKSATKEQVFPAMLSSPIIFFYGFFVLLVFVLGVAPTAFWQRVGASLSGRAGRWRVSQMTDRLARATKGASFTPDIDYTQAGIGFAADSSRALLFVAGERAGTAAEALLPLSAFRACATGVNTGGLSEDNYLDLFPADSGLSWRISCGADGATADAIAGQLGVLGVPRA